jgi:hypothetical protein
MAIHGEHQEGTATPSIIETIQRLHLELKRGIVRDRLKRLEEACERARLPNAYRC